MYLLSMLPEGFPSHIPEYDWFLKTINTPIFIFGIRIFVILAVAFICVTFIYYTYKTHKENKKEL